MAERRPTDIEVGVLEDPRDLLGKERWQVLRTLTEPEFRSLKSGIAEDGVVSSVVLDHEGHLIDGHHRVRAWCELADEGGAAPPVPYQQRHDLTDARDIRLLARKLNMQRRQLTQDERKAVIRTQLQETPERSDHWIADDLGAARTTVTRLRTAMAKEQSGGSLNHLSDPDLLPRSVVGRDGKWYEYTPRRKIEEQIAREKAEAEAKAEADRLRKEQEKAEREAEKDKAEEPGDAGDAGDVGADENGQQTLGEAFGKSLEQAIEDGDVPPPPEPPEERKALDEMLPVIRGMLQYEPEKVARTTSGPDDARWIVEVYGGVIGWLEELFAELETAAGEDKLRRVK